MSGQEQTRRERHRRRTIEEIKSTAVAQVREGGPEAVSFNAIARSMGMSAPALYRYFDSRDELLAELAADVHLDLAVALETAAAGAASPVARVRAVAHGYRNWALSDPQSYRLAHGSTHGSGREHAADRIRPAALRSMTVLLTAVAEAGVPSGAPVPASLEKQVRRWNGGGGQQAFPPGVLHFGLVWWSRLHGLVSLELGQHLTATGIDTGLLYRTEVEAMVGSLSHRYGATA
ncbi:MAG: TetR/AcrR family transcriptional regulator [Umezawaea sp.]